jgi:hypothetical protein
LTFDIKLCKKKISTICLKKQVHFFVFQIWHNLCSELTSMWTFKIYSRNTKTTNNKSDRPQVKIWDTWKTLKYLNINENRKGRWPIKICRFIFVNCTSSCSAFCFRQLVEGLLAVWFTRNISLDRSLSCEGRILSGQLLQPASENKDKRKHKDWC